jgi:(p)ppGpp synthase/HD superfamily hydrolase
LVTSDAGADEEVVAAGMLHDVLEDVLGPEGFEYVKKEFGQRVAQAVFDVSEKKDPKLPPGSNPPWQKRKQDYLDHLAAASNDALLVSMADKIHNLESITFSFKKMGPVVFEKFGNQEGKFLWYYEQVLAIGKQKLPKHLLTEHLAQAIDAGRAAFGQR